MSAVDEPTSTSVYTYTARPLPETTDKLTELVASKLTSLPPLPPTLPQPANEDKKKDKPRFQHKQESTTNTRTQPQALSPRSHRRISDHFFPEGTADHVRVELNKNKTLSNASQQRAWDHYLNTRPM